MLLLSSIDANEPVYRLSLSGPEDWYGNRPLVTQLEKGNKHLWLGNIRAASGTYEATIFGQTSGSTRSDFQIDTENALSPVSSLKTTVDSQKQLSSHWSASEQSEHFEVEVYFEEELLSKTQTDKTAFSYTSDELVAGNTYTICISNFNWKLGQLPAGQPNAARVCSEVNIPLPDRPADSNSSSSDGTTSPPPPPPPPPPNF